ncbi:MAG: hypothetical protein NTV79_03320 [Candidatus Aureabacteria bacterium]|nr:hypothetical protein [Candidatus Auribacterota bacterium]
MTARMTLPCLIALLTLIPFSRCAAGEITTVETLISSGAAYDGREVTIRGEVIGDIMERGGEYWLNVLSPEGVAIGVRAGRDQIESIACLGDYSHSGDTVAVKGIYYRYAQRFGGETCVIADEVRVVKAGATIAHPLPRGKILLSILLTLMSAGTAVILLYTNRTVRE